MIKRLLFTFLLVGIFLSALTLSLAQEATPYPSPKPTPVAYTLPFPGILPDHPLYFLKSLRDTILFLLIKNPVRRVEFHILQADKSLSSASMLFDKGDKTRGIQMTTKSVQQLVSGKNELFRIRPEENLQLNSLKDKFEKSALKHQEMIQDLAMSLEGQDKETLESLYEQLTTLLTDFSRNR